MASPAPVDVSDALDDLVNQFSDSMSFFRELIQNALDAGSNEVDVDFEFEPSEGDPDSGAMVVVVTDYGDGMDRAIIDSKLTRLFSSAKDGDMTKIGKFGIGFVSVFAIEPDAVCVDTARAGEAWRVLFDAERKFKRLRLDKAMEGTVVRIIKNTSRPEYEAFVERAHEVIRYWCRHANGEIRVAGELISEPFGLEAPVQITYRDDFSEIHLGHRRRSPTSHAYFNGGLTLVEAGLGHASVVEGLEGLCFKVSSRYLEHTLTRDDVIKDGHFHKVARRLRSLVSDALRPLVLSRLDAEVRAGWPDRAGPRAETATSLLEAGRWHADANGDLSRAEGKLACARAPSGRIWTWSDLADAFERAGRLLIAPAPSRSTELAEGQGLPVVTGWRDRDGGEDEAFADHLDHLAEALGRFRGVSPRLVWLGEAYFTPVAPEPSEVRQWEPLARMVARLLDDTGYKIAGCAFGRFADSGSDLGGRVAIGQREFGALTPAPEADELGRGLFSRRRWLVIDADHPVVRTLLGLSLREPELAAYQLIKSFFLVSGAIPAERDSELAGRAMYLRELRCPRPHS